MADGSIVPVHADGIRLYLRDIQLMQQYFTDVQLRFSAALGTGHSGSSLGQGIMTFTLIGFPPSSNRHTIMFNVNICHTELCFFRQYDTFSGS